MSERQLRKIMHAYWNEDLVIDCLIEELEYYREDNNGRVFNVS